MIVAQSNIPQSRRPQHAGSIADGERPPEPRLPHPLPHNVSRVARANLWLFGLLSVAGALFVFGSGIAVVAFPIVLGRDGVGRAMITLTLFCVAAVSTGVALLAARSAVRVVRRERRGVASLLAFVRFGAFVSVFVGGIVWWLSVAFIGASDGAEVSLQWGTVVAIGMCLIAFAFFVWGTLVLRGFRRSLGA